MAYLKGVDLSGSSDISGSIGIFGQVTGSSFTGSFTGSFLGDVIGTVSTASYVDYDNVANKPTLISSSDQISSEISGAFTADSASFSTRVTDLETFSSSLDDTFITETELNTATASLSSSLATDIATKANSASFATDIASLTTDSGSFSTRVTDLETFSSSLDDTFITETELNSATASLSSSLATDIATKANSASFATDIATLDSTTVKLTGDQSISGTKTFTGAITASDLRVTNTASIGYLQTIYETSSIIYSSGSTKFGDTLDDTHQITGSFLVTGSSYTINGEDIIITSALNASTSSLSSSLATGIASDSASLASSIVSNSSSAATDIAALVTDSGSFSTRVTDLETFSSSLDDTFITETELNSATASLSSSLAVDIAANSESISNIESFPYTGSAIISGSLIVTGSTNISGSVTAYGFNIDDNATGTPALYSSTNLNLSASNAVVVTDSPFRVASLTNAETGSFTSQDGDIIFNSTRAAYMVYSGSAWREVIIEGFTASYASQALSSSYAITASYAENVPSGTGFPYTGSAIVSGSLIVTGSIYSDSQIYATASHAISASLAQTSSYVTTAQTASYVETAQTASYVTTAQTASYVETSQTASYVALAQSANTASYVETAQTASYVTTAQTASYVETSQTASYVTTAQTASYIAGANVDGTVTSASYAANGGVTSITAGSGITIDQSTGNVTISTETIAGGSIASGSFTSTTTTSLTHNFGSTNVIVATYDESGNEIIPASITLDSANAVTATFAAAQSGDIVAIEAQTGEFATASFSSTGSVILNHSLGTQDLNVVAYDTNNVQFVPDIEVLDSSNVKATFAASSSGTLLAVARDGSVSASFSNTVNETITHNLSGSAIFVTVYDTSYNEIIPDSVSIVDTSSINLTFAATSSGNVVIAGGVIDATTVTTATTYTQAISGSSSYTVDHNLNAEWPLVQVYDSASRAQYVPQSVVSVNASTVNITFSAPFNGFVTINS